MVTADGDGLVWGLGCVTAELFLPPAPRRAYGMQFSRSGAPHLRTPIRGRPMATFGPARWALGPPVSAHQIWRIFVTQSYASNRGTMKRSNGAQEIGPAGFPFGHSEDACRFRCGFTTVKTRRNLL